MKTHIRLKVWMIEQGKRQQEFAASLGVHRETLNAIVNGRKLPGDPVAILIEARTGILASDWAAKKKGKIMTELYDGMWDFDGACAPSEDGTRRGQGETFSLGCFQWVKMARGLRLKRAKVTEYFRGRSDNPAPVYAAARGFCAKRNSASDWVSPTVEGS